MSRLSAVRNAVPASPSRERARQPGGLRDRQGYEMKARGVNTGIADLGGDAGLSRRALREDGISAGTMS